MIMNKRKVRMSAKELGRESWLKQPRSREEQARRGKAGWTEERREKQREIMKLLNLKNKQVIENDYATSKQKNEGKE
jgi:hypothetical protein